MAHFSTRSLLIIATGVALYAGISQAIGYATAAACLMAVAALLALIRSKLKGWAWLVARCYLGLIAAFLLWIVAVDALWRRDNCTVCGSERHTIGFRLLGFTIAETTQSVPTWAALVGRDLGAPCRHDYAPWEPWASWQSSNPSRHRGALFPLLVMRYTPPQELWRFHDVGRKWYFEVELLTASYDQALRDEVLALKDSQPNLAESYWNQIQVDRGYLYDCLLTDLRVRAAIKGGDLSDARAWLDGSLVNESRSLWHGSGEEMPQLLRDLEAAGFEGAYVCQPSRWQVRDGKPDSTGDLVARLPTGEAARRKALALIARLRDETEDREEISDYGQDYVLVFR